MNNITTKGNIGSDPEIKFVGALAIASFSLAHTPRRNNKGTQAWEDAETIAKGQAAKTKYIEEKVEAPGW